MNLARSSCCRALDSKTGSLLVAAGEQQQVCDGAAVAVVGQKRCPLSFVRYALSFVHPPLTHHSSSSYRHSIQYQKYR